MSRAICRVAALAFVLAVTPAHAHGPNAPPHQTYRIGDFPQESGETIKDFAISYVTHGTLNAQKSNAILMVTAISGNHHRIDFLIGPGVDLSGDLTVKGDDMQGWGSSARMSRSDETPRVCCP